MSGFICGLKIVDSQNTWRFAGIVWATRHTWVQEEVILGLAVKGPIPSCGVVLSVGETVNVGQGRTSVWGRVCLLRLDRHIVRSDILTHSAVVAVMWLRGRRLALLVGIRTHIVRHVVCHAIRAAKVVEV